MRMPRGFAHAKPSSRIWIRLGRFRYRTSPGIGHPRMRLARRGCGPAPGGVAAALAAPHAPRPAALAAPAMDGLASAFRIIDNDPQPSGSSRGMTANNVDAATPNPAADADAALLAKFGYRQELRRKLSGFSNFAVSFSISSVLAGCLTSYSIAMLNGGPAAITLGWLLVGGMVTFVALSMAEVCSVYPTAGALYWWAFALAKRNKAA